MGGTHVVTKVLDAETETKTEAAGFKTEAKTKAVYLKTEAEAQDNWPILLTVLSSIQLRKIKLNHTRWPKKLAPFFVRLNFTKY